MYTHYTTRTQKYSSVYTVNGYAFERKGSRFVPTQYAIVPLGMPASFKTLKDAATWLRCYNPINTSKVA